VFLDAYFEWCLDLIIPPILTVALGIRGLLFAPRRLLPLYATMLGWTRPPVIYGDTGWPCCPRDKIARPGISTRQAVVEDLDRMIPPGHSGRAWLLYTIRPTHWDWVGLDESNVWRDHLTDRGCKMPKPYLQFENLAITLAVCR
jgi:hypothetical protein